MHRARHTHGSCRQVSPALEQRGPGLGWSLQPPDPCKEGRNPFLAAGSCGVPAASKLCQCWGSANLAGMPQWGDDTAGGSVFLGPFGVWVLPGPHPAATAGGVGCSPQPSVDLPAGGTLRQWESRCRRTAGSHRCHGHWPPEHPSSEHPLPAPPSVRPHAAGRFPFFFNYTTARFPSKLLWR